MREEPATRKIVHISDIHFGRVDYATVKPLIKAVSEVAPDVIVVSGDLTQRARRWQFREARAFLDSLPKPQIVVPGNHDVPLYNLVARFAAPLANYRKYLSDDPEPCYQDLELVIQGINTARSLAWKNGQISERQIERVRRVFCGAPPGVTKVLVTHHPLDLPRRFDESHLVGRAALAMPMLAACGADVLLAGHYHISHTGDTQTRYPIAGFSALVIQAGTTTSARLRDEPNSFNLLEIARGEIAVDRYAWRPAEGVFASFLGERFHYTEQGWMRLAAEERKRKQIVVPGTSRIADSPSP